MSARSYDDLLRDLIELCRETTEHARGVDLEDFLEAKTLQRAVERTLALIGEVATQLGDRRPKVTVPWDQITRLRILLAHVYHKVEPRVIYDTGTKGVPLLLRALEEADLRRR